MTFKNKTIFITGASRGIGKAIALKLAAEGANIIIAAKSIEENPKLGGTIYSAANEIEKAGGKALPVQCDIRFEDQIKNAVDTAVSTFGGIDVLINNASAIYLSKTEQTESKAFSLMHDINVRGTFFVSVGTKNLGLIERAKKERSRIFLTTTSDQINNTRRPLPAVRAPYSC